MISAASIISLWGPFYKAERCDKLASFYKSNEALLAVYPSCNASTSYVAVKADMNAGNAGNVAAALNLSFGMSVWLALALHAIGVEIYVSNFSLTSILHNIFSRNVKLTLIF